MTLEEDVLIHVGKMNLGFGHFFEVMLGQDDKLVGWLHSHPDARNPSEACQSICAVRPVDGAPVHDIIRAEPLSLSPSLKCRTCGAHGRVINGQWEPC